MPLMVAAQSQLRYQTILNDNEGVPIMNTTVSVDISILQSTSSGTVVFSETHSATTDAQGLISISIGSITPLDASILDPDNGPYFLQVSVDSEMMGTTQLVSVPSALYADQAGTVDSFSYDDLTGAPDITGWDLDVSDDFDGDYSSLINAPVTISSEQQTKLSNISLTAPADLDALASDVSANNEKVSFPGFGTVPGTALEAGTDIWTQSGNNVFYNQGKVGVGVPTSTQFGTETMLVGGGIKYEGFTFSNLPPNEPGLFFFLDDTGGFQSFAFYDEQGGLNLLSNTSIWAQSGNDIYAEADVIAGSSLGVGVDIVNGEDFGFATIKMKENNTRILFDDSDDPGGSAPSNDWQLVANSSSNGGDEYFAIEDVTAGTLPFVVSAGAPDNSFFLDSSGNLGIGTNAPSATLDVNGTIKAATFVGDGSGLTGITGGTGGVSNAGSTTISAGTGVIDFQTNGESRMQVTNTGNVGIGTTSPSAKLEVNGDVIVNGGLKIQGNLSVTGAVSYGTSSIIEPSTVSREYDVSQSNVLIIDVANSATVTVSGLASGVTGQVVTLVNNGEGTLTLSHAGAGSFPFLLTGSVDASLLVNQSATVLFDGTNWMALSINN